MGRRIIMRCDIFRNATGKCDVADEKTANCRSFVEQTHRGSHVASTRDHFRHAPLLLPKINAGKQSLIATQFVTPVPVTPEAPRFVETQNETGHKITKRLTNNIIIYISARFMSA